MLVSSMSERPASLSWMRRPVVPASPSMKTFVMCALPSLGNVWCVGDAVYTKDGLQAGVPYVRGRSRRASARASTAGAICSGVSPE